MHITEIDITVQVLNDAGNPTSAPTLYGVVRNHKGAIVDTLTFERLTEETVGFYVIRGYDVSDTNKFPGTELSVFWCTKAAGVTPEKALQIYVIFGQHPSGYKTRLLQWIPSYRKTGLYGFEIQRQKPGEPGLSFLARTTFPYYFDRSEYEDVAEFHRSVFSIKELIWKSDEPNVPGIGQSVTMFDIIENDHDYCQIHGRIVDIGGGAGAEMLTFYVHESDGPQSIGYSQLMRRNGVTAPLNMRGEFSIPLIQGALVTVEMSDARIIQKFVVPRKHSCQFDDLTFYPMETYRAQ